MPKRSRPIHGRVSYSSSSLYPFNVLDRAHKAKSIVGLKNCLTAASERAADCRAIPWPALAASWQETADAIAEILRARLLAEAPRQPEHELEAA